eukprot:3574548-Pleurochrysis_carterae.AAC.1
MSCASPHPCCPDPQKGISRTISKSPQRLGHTGRNTEGPIDMKNSRFMKRRSLKAAKLPIH